MLELINSKYKTLKQLDSIFLSLILKRLYAGAELEHFIWEAGGGQKTFEGWQNTDKKAITSEGIKNMYF